MHESRKGRPRMGTIYRAHTGDDRCTASAGGGPATRCHQDGPERTDSVAHGAGPPGNWPRHEAFVLQGPRRLEQLFTVQIHAWACGGVIVGPHVKDGMLLVQVKEQPFVEG